MSHDRSTRTAAHGSLPQLPVEELPTRMACAELVFKLRRMRDQVLGTSLFGEPAWDALLLLATARDRGEEATLGQIMLDLRLPEDAARRVLANLCQADLVDIELAQCGDPATPVALTEEGCAKLAIVLG